MWRQKWYHVKSRTTAQNMPVERDTLSVYVYELDALQMYELGDPTQRLRARGGARTKIVPFESVLLVSYYLLIVTKALSLTVFA